jgi:Sec-independent protein translocase protein TatA
MGKAIREFKKSFKDVSDDLNLDEPDSSEEKENK